MFRNTLSVALLALVALIPSCKNPGAGAGADYSSDADYVSGMPLPERQEGVSFLSGNVNKNQFEPVYFDFDSYNVPASENYKLQQVVSFMGGSGNTIIIAGFTDERGTAEYNRTLGERRAQAVREILIGMGADGSRLQTVSFGEEMPANPGGGESAWAANRRAEFGVVQ
jgi:peptidoglycan-associated lipoprotein